MFEKFTKEEVQAARKKVAADWRGIHKRIREENSYASHVTEETKINALNKGLNAGDDIESGKLDGNFTIAQRIYTELTGECIGFLP